MDIAELLKALGDPTRFAIYSLLLMRKHCVRSLAKKMGITESAVSQHLKILKTAGLVYSERFGHHMHYMPVQAAVDAIAEAFESMRCQSLSLDRDSKTCHCEFKKQEAL